MSLAYFGKSVHEPSQRVLSLNRFHASHNSAPKRPVPLAAASIAATDVNETLSSSTGTIENGFPHWPQLMCELWTGTLWSTAMMRETLDGCRSKPEVEE